MNPKIHVLFLTVYFWASRNIVTWLLSHLTLLTGLVIAYSRLKEADYKPGKEGAAKAEHTSRGKKWLLIQKKEKKM